MTQLIACYSERKRLHNDKLTKAMTFLKHETYSNFDNLLLVLGYNSKASRSPVYRILNKLLGSGFIQKKEFEFQAGKISIWGITELGLAQFIQSPDEDFRAFEPHRVKFLTLEHKLMNQKVQIYLQKNGWTDWQNADQYAFRRRYDIEHRPDAIINAPNGYTIAIETERTLKPVARYRSIFKSHILAKQKKYWSAVFYVVPNEGVKQLLNKRFDRVEYIEIDKSKHPFAHYRSTLVRIFTLDEIKTLSIQ